MSDRYRMRRAKGTAPTPGVRPYTPAELSRYWNTWVCMIQCNLLTLPRGSTPGHLGYWCPDDYLQTLLNILGRDSKCPIA